MSGMRVVVIYTSICSTFGAVVRFSIVRVLSLVGHLAVYQIITNVWRQITNALVPKQQTLCYLCAILIK